MRYILYPFSLLYGNLVRLHRAFYQYGNKKAKSFDIPVINVGNLSVGGTGKSPHVAYFTQMLQPILTPGIVSRGYHRQTTGVRLVETNSLASEVGDEPLQLKQRFPNNTVVVAERRVLGVEAALKENKAIDCILLDDAFQHWAIQPSLQIMLTTFEQPFFRDWVLPMGRLREFRSGYQRADIIIITKCPTIISQAQKVAFLQAIKPLPSQRVFFSYFKYQALYQLFDKQQLVELDQLKNQKITLVTAIATTHYLEEYITSYASEVQALKFPDHHHYTLKDLEKIKKISSSQLIITTEKDATKLKPYQAYLAQENLLIYVLPIEVQIAFNEENLLRETLLNHLNRD